MALKSPIQLHEGHAVALLTSKLIKVTSVGGASRPGGRLNTMSIHILAHIAIATPAARAIIASPTRPVLPVRR